MTAYYKLNFHVTATKIKKQKFPDSEKVPEYLSYGCFSLSLTLPLSNPIKAFLKT